MDEIQRKLELFEKRLAGRWAFHRRMIGSSPLLFVAVGLIAGICLQRYLNVSYWVWLMLLLVFFAAVASYYVYGSWNWAKRVNPAIVAYLALLCALCLGGVRLAGYGDAAPNDIRNFVGPERMLATIRGSVVTDPYTRYREDWAFARFLHSDPSSSFYLQLTEAEAVDGWAQVTGMVRVVVDEPILDLKAGDRIEAYCWLSRFREATNPGQFDLADYMGNRNVYVGASVKSHEGIKLLSGKDSGSWAGLKSRFRATVSKALLDDESVEERERGLLEALLLGYRGNIDVDTYRAFQKTGLLHFISLSGMHLGILAGMVWRLAARAGLLKPARAFVCIVVIALFLIVVPPRAPTIRAAVICLIFCLSIFFSRYPNPLNTLSIAAVVLLLIRPTGLFEPGWQLSFASVLGILMFCQRFYSFLREKLIPEFLRDEDKKINPLLKVVVSLESFVLAVFSTSVTGWLGGAGILLYHFYAINPLTSVWTVVAFPLVACILGLGFLKILMSFLLPSLSALLGVLLNFLAWALIELVRFLGRIDFSEILVGRVSIGVVLLYYGAIAVIAWAWYLRPVARRITVVCTVLLVAGTVGFIKLQRMYPRNLRMTCLDVGHGQAIVMQSPAGTLLFDAGSQYNHNIGRRVVVPFLRCRGITEVDSLIISHDDIDHINGIVEIVKNSSVRNVYASRVFINKSSLNGTAQYLADCLAKEGIALKPLPDSINVNTPVRVKILWPDDAACRNEALSDNNTSVVSLVEFAGKRILLCSDIEDFAQRQLIASYPDLRADVVVVPHHGSLRSGGSGFIDGLGAAHFVCSCGAGYFERLHKADRLHGPEWFYTARDSAVSVRIDQRGNIAVDNCGQ